MENRERKGNNQNMKKSNKNNSQAEKKPFNKKKYREQKYSNKFKVNQWEERRKKAILRSFHKELKKDERYSNLNSKDNKESSEKTNNISEYVNNKIKGGFFSAKREAFRRKQEKQAKKEAILQAQKERKEALQEYKEKKMRIFKELSKKTKKGQPVMKGRMELLLEKIERNVLN